MISVVTELGEFLWQDEAWMKERERFASREVPVSIYETDVTEWKNSGELVEFLKETRLYACRISSGDGVS